MKNIVFIDTEISYSGDILDMGALSFDGATFHSSSIQQFKKFLSNYEYICGHNIIHHDLKFISHILPKNAKFVDTLYLSPLLFPKRPYHKLIKDDKIYKNDTNNPLSDAQKSAEIFVSEIDAFNNLEENIKKLYSALLYDYPEFEGFFYYIDYPKYNVTSDEINSIYDGYFCTNSNLSSYMSNFKMELAYSLALMKYGSSTSITPPWVIKNHPYVENIIKSLRGNPCKKACKYCKNYLNIHKNLKYFFGYDDFRLFDGENLQEKSVQSAINGKSHLCIFPTGGGKSLSFQLPALMSGRLSHSLTVVISPLQSLMKDQVDNLEKKGITDCVTVNGLLDPIERKNAYERILRGDVSILYISPEQLRSKTIEKVILSRSIERFVIDEAHCFSSWGQDFRVDYLYIADFIKKIEQQKSLTTPIPVSCFTATAKQKVISDIKDYFKSGLDINMDIYATDATRKNLRYCVIYKSTEEEKYIQTRSLILSKNCPTIVYTTFTRTTLEICEKLVADGIKATAYNGKMDSDEKIKNQEDFMKDEVQVIVATSAFGMGVDKSDVGLVIHYDISDSLENYVQEAGRAGRDENINADCYILYNKNDLDKHFSLLNNSKLTMNEIQQVFTAIKNMTKNNTYVTCSPLEIARNAGWDDSKRDIETRVKTAVNALEKANYIKREQSYTTVYTTSIEVNNVSTALDIMDSSGIFTKNELKYSTLIISYLMTEKQTTKSASQNSLARVDYMADIIGISKDIVITCINKMKSLGILSDSDDMSAFIQKSETKRKSSNTLNRFIGLEKFLLNRIEEGENIYNLKELNENATEENVLHPSIKNIKILLNYWSVIGDIKKYENHANDTVYINLQTPLKTFKNNCHRRHKICTYIIDKWFSDFFTKISSSVDEQVQIPFSMAKLYKDCNKKFKEDFKEDITLKEIEHCLLYLTRINSIKLDGGFLVVYNTLKITKLIKNNLIRYKNEDYKTLKNHYKQKIFQIHIVGEFANIMMSSYQKALQFVYEYFHMDFRKFIQKYFTGERLKQIQRNITPEKYKKIFKDLSPAQKKIIDDDTHQYITVVAGPGSGKTKVLVHKLASLLILEDIKSEQLLMLTFSRASAIEFKKRLYDLIGGAAFYVDIRTFHSYCFDILGRKGDIEKLENIEKTAIQAIKSGEVERQKITKAILVIDEAQDMDKNQYQLVKILIKANEDMRVIAVGDDDQNIYSFRGSSSEYMTKIFESSENFCTYELLTNYRSKEKIVDFSNDFATSIKNRIKESPCVAFSKEKGVLEITKYRYPYMSTPTVNHIKNSHQGDYTTAVLTMTNEQSLKIISCLTQNDIPAKLIQSNEITKLCYNLVEMRYFISQLSLLCSTPIIPKSVWEKAKDKLKENYSTSKVYNNIKKMILEFEKINKSLFLSDFKEYLMDIDFDDYHEKKKNEVIVSTIHKSKGKEYDIVYMLLNPKNMNDDVKRAIYVAMTRAKNNLYIGYCGELFDYVKDKNIDNTRYADSQDIIIKLGYKDVNLGYFKDKKMDIFHLRSGQALYPDNHLLKAKIANKFKHVILYSKNFQNRLKKLKSSGYYPYKSEIRYILAWQYENEDKKTCETPIILPTLYLKKIHK